MVARIAAASPDASILRRWGTRPWNFARSWLYPFFDSDAFVALPPLALITTVILRQSIRCGNGKACSTCSGSGG
eukprot:1017581-Prymnesium_polylepis.2